MVLLVMPFLTYVVDRVCDAGNVWILCMLSKYTMLFSVK